LPQASLFGIVLTILKIRRGQFLPLKKKNESYDPRQIIEEVKSIKRSRKNSNLRCSAVDKVSAGAVAVVEAVVSAVDELE